MVSYLLLIVAIGFVLTCLTAKIKKLSGYLALICILALNVIIFYVAINAFKSPSPLTLKEPLFSIPAIGADLTLAVDKLSALFLVLIGIISLLATLYSIDYMSAYRENHLLRFYPFLILFVAAMIGVVCVSDLFFFFVFWELMTLASYILVVYEKEDGVVLRAGYKYFLMTHIATALMFIAGIVLRSYTGSFSFAGIEKAVGMMTANPIGLHVILALFFIGFATKAGAYPFGTWLPDAHPAAPSGISAILSGIMIKMGIYGILRVFLYMLPVSSYSYGWGIVIATFGVISILIGTSQALIQKDSKRLLAFSSIGQIGYVLLAIGIGISFTKDYPAIAVVAIIAGLFHLINHAFFKSLLFLNTGSILFKTGTRDLNKLGGLWSIMPLTAFTAIFASMSISGFPPFNGFASKWLIYQVSVIGGIKLPIYIFYGIVAFFVSALTMAYVVKFFSTAFLGDIPDYIQKQGSVRDVTLGMNISQNILAVLCLLLGLIPLLPISLIYASLANSKMASFLPSFGSLFGQGKNGIEIFMAGSATGIWKPLFLSIIFLGLLALTYAIFRSGGSKKRTVAVWLCGEEYDKEQVRYRAHSYYLSLQRLIEKWLTPHFKQPSFKKPEGLYRALDLDRWFYSPAGKWSIAAIKKLRKTHVGTPQIYMLWQAIGIFLVVLVLFLFVR